eukprot:scaffold11.g4046.t1
MQQTSLVRATGAAPSGYQRVASCAKQAFRACAAPSRLRSQRLVVRAASDDDDFEARLAALKQAKGETPYGAGKKAAAAAIKGAPKGGEPQYDYTDETLYFESAPHGGDLAINAALGTTVVWLPLTFAAVGRSLFVKYRLTDRRLSVITTAPWKTEQLDAAYQEVKDVVSVGRGVGLWGDMVVTLRNGDKIEMRAVPQFKELQAYILRRRDELTGGGGGGAAEASVPGSKGFA